MENKYHTISTHRKTNTTPSVHTGKQILHRQYTPENKYHTVSTHQKTIETESKSISIIHINTTLPHDNWISPSPHDNWISNDNTYINKR
jgi:hypothetical protein